MINKYVLNKLVAWVDLSTYCNAGCPQCHRTDPNGLGKIDWLPLTQWSLEDFKQAFPLESLRKISKFEICGTWGDPFMCKDIFEILKYIIDNSDCWIQINTNGGMRDDEFWWNLGVLGRNRMEVIFDVDGINQEMHSHYRRKVDFEALKSHIECYTAAGGKAFAHIITFKHNEKYVKEIIDMCYNELGITNHLVQRSTRFYEKSTFEFIDEHGNPSQLEEVEEMDNSLYELPSPVRDHRWHEKVGYEKLHEWYTTRNKKLREKNE